MHSPFPGLHRGGRSGAVDVPRDNHGNVLSRCFQAASDYSYDPTLSGSGSGGYYQGSYVLHLTNLGPLANGTLATATPLSFNGGVQTEVSAILQTGADVNLYQIQLPANQGLGLKVAAQSLGSSLVSDLRIFDSSGKEIAFNRNANGGDPTLNFRTTAAGTYYIGVSSDGNRACCMIPPWRTESVDGIQSRQLCC